MGNSIEPLERILDSIVMARDEDWTAGMIQRYANQIVVYYARGGANKYAVTYSWVHGNNAENYDYLVQRLVDIRPYIQQQKTVEKFDKLRDYINLEISRAYDSREIADSVKEANEAVKELKEARLQLSKERDSIRQEIWDEHKTSNTQSVTVLSIFTGIVMAFFGGFALFDGAVSNFTQGDDFKLIFAIAFIGFVLFNTIFCLIYAASRIMKIDIKSSCKYGNCRKEDGNIDCHNPSREDNIENKITCGLFGKLIHKFSYVFAVNAIIIIVMIVFGLCYLGNTNYATYISNMPTSI